MKKLIFLSAAILVAAVASADALSVTPAVPYSPWARKFWLDRFDEKKALAAKGDYPVVFIGDSITHNWEKKGTEVWARNYAEGDYRALNAGFSGDRTENVLWRLQHGQIDGLDPKAVVLMIGTNNIGHRPGEQECAFDTFCGIQMIVEDLLKRCPNAKIIVHPIFPRGATTNDQMRIRVDAVNLMLADWISNLYVETVRANKRKPGDGAAPRVLMCDFSSKLVGPDGVLSKEMAPDLLHPVAAGYEIWANELKPYLDYALGKTKKSPWKPSRFNCPTAIPQDGIRAATAKSQPYWLAGANGRDMRYLKKINEISDHPDHYYDIVLLGDSITHFWEKPANIEHFKKTFAGYSVLNLAFGGHHTEHVLWNVTYGGYIDRIQTRLFTLLIGTNNHGDSPEDTALGIKRTLDALAAKQPNAKVILLPIFPRYRWPKPGKAATFLPGSPERLRNEKINELIRPYADGKRVFWCDFNDKLVGPDGIPPKEILGDGTHPAEKGYDIWAAAMMPIVREILGARQETRSAAKCGDIEISCRDFTLIVGKDAIVKSLKVKATGEECLDAAQMLPIFTATQDRPFNNEQKLIHPNKRTVYPACSLRREGDTLIAGFPHRLYEAKVSLKITDGYVAFTLDDFICDRKSTYDYLKMDIPPVASFRVLQLPVKNRKNFGDWLNASWDDKVAVGVVGTSPHPDITHEERVGTRILFGEVYAGIKLRGASAALIAAPGREAFLDAMDSLERDFGMPRGVESRRGAAVKEFIFHLSSGASPETMDELIGYAQKGGFKLMTFNQGFVTKEIGSWGTFGNYDLREDHFPNGLDDLRAMLAKVKAAGIKPGLHTLHSHIGLKSRYVTPVADPRLNKIRRFTLAEALPAGTNDIAEVRVFEPTADTPMFEPCRILQFGGELLSYESYTAEPPYRFLGVKRGVHATTVTAHPKGEIGGILHVSEYGTPMSCYLDQNTDLQDEVADKIAKIYNCGFEYVYLDGSEGVHPPFNFHVANGQYRLWKKLKPEPLFGEGAAKTHFGWHMLAGANAFDCFSPTVFKEKLREFPFRQAPITGQDMSRVDFGWWGFWAPGSRDWWGKAMGVQADMWEYGASVAAAWNCAISITMPLAQLRKHPRTDDILETMRRWGDVRRRGLFREEWRKPLKNYSQEHHLLINAKGEYELVPYWMVSDGLKKEMPIRAFAFEKDGATWVVYWHVSGSGEFTLPLKANDVALYDEFAGKPVEFKSTSAGVVLPAGNRLYLRTSATRAEVKKAFSMK